MTLLPDYTVFIQIANFLILLFVLNIIAYRPIRRMIHQRKEEIALMSNMAEEWNKKAETFAEQLNKNEIMTRKEGLKEKEDHKNQGIDEEKRMLQEAHVSTEEEIEMARKNIQVLLNNVRQSLQAEVDGFSRELAAKILGRAIEC
ncbi:MAG: ATP synthase F0 subunit B [Deltaproteobacteria bacterium]|nr:ATP synthase F0 subunit B [Deltaproteobacteria bacterium]